MQLAQDIPKGKYQHVTKIIDQEIAFLEWTGNSKENEVSDGVDSYLFRGGKIAAQTIHYTVQKK